MYGVTVKAVTQCSRIYPAKSGCIHAPARPTHGLVYFVEGINEYVYDGVTYTATPGTVIYLPQGRAYDIFRTTPSQCVFVNFTTVQETREEPFVKHYANHVKFRDALQSLLYSYRCRRVGYEAECLGILYGMLAMIQASDRAAYLPRARFQKILPAVDYINTHFTGGDIRTEKLAALSGVSVRYFNKLFAVYFGVSPREYIIRLRLDAAQNLLSSTVQTVSEIASACGFTDVYYFSKVFRKLTGMTPSEYRKANKPV